MVPHNNISANYYQLKNITTNITTTITTPSMIRSSFRNIIRHKSSLPETVTIVPKLETLTDVNLHKNDFVVPLIAHLQNRHLVESITSDDLYKIDSGLKIYCGADPLAPSLHLGNMLPLMTLLHFALRGHPVVALVGGATGSVGDPSGRTTERTEISSDQRSHNVGAIQNQMVRILNNGIQYAKLRNYPIDSVGTVTTANNADWLGSVKLLDFLAEYGRHIRVSSMLARDSVQSRLNSAHGIGFNEFTYQILQAYDFWHLYRDQGVNVQVGGNDQWGNIIAGVDLISRMGLKYKSTVNSGPAFGVTVPLLTSPSGEKFGKSAGNAVFVDETLTSPYQLYQYFINIGDDMVIKLLKSLTLLPLQAIEHVKNSHNQDPAYRIAQRALAREVCDLIHGNGTGVQMAYITSFLFPTPDQPFNDEVSADRLIQAFKKSGILVKISKKELEKPDLKLSSLLAIIMNKSKSETKNLIKSGGIYMGLERDQLHDPDDVVLFDELMVIDNKMMLIRAGKQRYYVVEIEL